jgi:hypothetical protein
LGNTSNTLVLDSLATGVQVAKGLLFTGANNNLISTVGSVTNVGYPTNTYTQLSGGHVRLGSDKLYDSGGVNLISKSGTDITIGSSGVTTTINGTFESTDIAFLNVAAGASKKLYYTFSGDATEYDFLKITRDATTEANSIVNVGNTSHKLQFNSSSDKGILINSDGGIKIAATEKNMMKYVESLGIYSIDVGNTFDDLNLAGSELTFTATTLATPAQFLIANANGVAFGAENELLTLKADSTLGIRLESFLKNSNNRKTLDYDSGNTTNIYGTATTDKTQLKGAEIDVVSTGDIDFQPSASGGTTYGVKIDTTGNIKFTNPSGGDVFGDRPTSSSFTTKERCGNIHCRNVFADNHIYMSYGYWRSFDNGDHSFVVLETYYAAGGGSERDTVRFGSTFDTDIYLSASNQNKRFALQNDGQIVQYDDAGDDEYTFDRTYTGSERRLKQNIVELDKTNSLDLINRLKPSSYQYKNRPTINVTGFIVDEVEGLIDEMVFESTSKDKDGNVRGKIKNISKPALIPTLVSAIQKLTERVTQLENIIIANNLSL